MDIIHVDIFSPFSSIEGWFTLKNGNRVNKKGNIPGLNLGLNTDDDPSQIKANQQRILKFLQLEGSEVAFARQVHGDHIKTVDQGGIYPDTDALITKKPGLMLAIQVADCAAVLIGDPGSGVIAAAHAGWRGAVSEIIPQTVHQLIQSGSSRPENMVAYISPAICKKHFEVGPEVSRQFPSSFVDTDSYDKPHVDLKGFIRRQLIDHKIPEQQIQVDKGCTLCEENKYYSFRRERERAGRMLGLIRLAG